MVRIGSSSARAMIAAPSFSSPFSVVAAFCDRRDAAEQGHAAAGHDALGHGRAGGVQGVLDAGLGLLHLGLGRAADADDGHAAGQLGQPLLNFSLSYSLSVCLDLAAELVDPLLDVGLLAGALMMVVLSFSTLTCLACAELREREVLQLQAEVLADERAAGQHGDVAEHRLAAIAEARRLDGADVAARRAAC